MHCSRQSTKTQHAHATNFPFVGRHISWPCARLGSTHDEASPCVSNFPWEGPSQFRRCKEELSSATESWPFSSWAACAPVVVAVSPKPSRLGKLRSLLAAPKQHHHSPCRSLPIAVYLITKGAFITQRGKPNVAKVISRLQSTLTRLS